MILAATLCLAAVSPALGITTSTYEYDWVQTSGSPTFSGYLVLDAPSGTHVAASTAIVDWSISDGSLTYTYTPSDSVLSGGAFLTWGSIGGGVSQITSISPDIFIFQAPGPQVLTITADSITENFDPGGGFYLNGITPGSTVPDVFNTAGLLGIGLAGLAGFNLRFRHSRRGLPTQPNQLTPVVRA